MVVGLRRVQNSARRPVLRGWRPPPAPQPDPPVPAAVRLDNAWRALALVNDWIKHAETKAVATLAASGVAGGVLYTLVRGEPKPSLAFKVTAVACAVFVLGGGLGAGMALRPRLRSREEPSNLLYYNHLARMYPTRADKYTDALTALVQDPDELMSAVAGQVWANAHVARRKYRWGGAGIACLLLGLAALGATAFVAAVGAR